MKLVIDRKRWLRGEGGEESRLLRYDGKMCCLGFFACALGVPEKDLLGVVEPEESQHLPWPEWLLRSSETSNSRHHTFDAGALIKTNDSLSCGAKDREATITRIFAQHGVEVTFVDGPEGT